MHDAERQAGYLRQVLGQARRPIALLIGAGAPVALRVNGKPLIPDVAGLTEVVSKEVAKSDVAEPFELLLKQLPEHANIEQILTHARSLRAVAGEDDVRGLKADSLDRIDALICQTITSAVKRDLPEPPTPYHRLASWIGSLERSFPVELFTPNYDLLFEQAFEDTKVPYFDGFVGARQPFFDGRAIDQDDLPARWARLWKLHGSISWSYSATGVVRTPPGESTSPQLIYPSHLKYDESRRMPYLAMIDRLRAFLRRPSAVLVTAGFSYRDEHLNDILIQGLQGNSTAVVFALLHGELKTYVEATRLAVTRSNLTLLAKDRGVIGTREAEWAVLESRPPQSDSLAVDWAEDGGKHRSSFGLGDFARFGDFLASVMGSRESSGAAEGE